MQSIQGWFQRGRAKRHIRQLQTIKKRQLERRMAKRIQKLAKANLDKRLDIKATLDELMTFSVDDIVGNTVGFIVNFGV